MKKRIMVTTVVVLCILSMTVGAVTTAVVKKIEAELRPDFTIVIDGEVREFKNAQGKVVYPVLYEGTTYLPIRAIGELMGKKVYWYEDDKRIELKAEKSTVTDADVIITDKIDKPVDTAPVVKPADTALISEAKAKEIALARAGVSAEEVKFIKVELDRDGGIIKYEIEFEIGKIEYDIGVNAVSGEVVSFEKDVD